MARDRNQSRTENIEEELTELTERTRGLETQLGHLRQLNRALIEYLALQARISPQELLNLLADHHLDLLPETVHCKDCGTLIARDSKACYSCGRKVDADLYILG